MFSGNCCNFFLLKAPQVLKSLTNRELKFFLCVQAICLLFATVGLSFREYSYISHGEGLHWSYIVMFFFLLSGLLLQLFTRNRVRQILLSLGICYVFFSVILTLLI